MNVVSRVGELFREQWEYRELLASITQRDLLVRYKQTLFGVGWAIFTPLLHMLVFTVIFTRVVRLETDLPYPIYAYAGLLPWNMFASALRFGAVSLTNNAALVTKVYFPREIFPFSAILVSLVDFAVGATVLGGLMVWYGVPLHATVAFLPVVLLVQIAFTAGLGLLIAMANLYYRDVRYVFEVLLVVWMFATSVVYPVERIGGAVGTLFAANPMTPIIDAYRTILLRGELPAAGPFAAAAAVSLALLLVGWLWFHHAEFRFAEDI